MTAMVGLYARQRAIQQHAAVLETLVEAFGAESEMHFRLPLISEED